MNNMNNKCVLIGEIVSEPTYSHQLRNNQFYKFNLSTNRLNNTKDTIIIVSNKLVDLSSACVHDKIKVDGSFRSRRKIENGRNRLMLSVLADKIEFLTPEQYEISINQIFLDGYVCKPPVYRKTPRGREITNLLIAVNRPYGKSDYIPCICWGNNARLASVLPVGSKIKVWGRIQSREYIKRQESLLDSKRIAYEVSIEKMEVENVGACNH